MKKINQFVSLLLALMLIVSLAAPAMASEIPDTPAPAATTYTITITNSVTGHVYEAYQIFTGTLHDKTLSNIEWGDGITETGKTAMLTKYDAEDAADLATKITDAKAFAKDVSGHLQNPKTSTAGTGSYSIGGLEAGYYVVKDKDNSLDNIKETAYTDWIVQVVGNISMSPKSSVPSIEKNVSDINDSHDTIAENKLDSADYDIGDMVPFHLHITLGNNLNNFTTYKVVVHDTLSAGLTYDPTSLVVQYGTSTISSEHYTVETASAAEGGTNITITFADVFAFGASSNGSIVIDYDAQLNENAVLGSKGNPNKVYMQYSNNPGSDTLGTSKEDTAIVFTYQVNVNKTDGENPLNGAAFTLYKSVLGEWKVVKAYTVDLNKTTFEFKGLDDGLYRLVETVTPSGYNTIEPVEFEVKPDHGEGKGLTLNGLNGEITTGMIDLTDKVLAGNASTGLIEMEVVNEKGATLPSTGGMGTTMFYLVGGLLVCAAVVLLITKKRMAVEE